MFFQYILSFVWHPQQIVSSVNTLLHYVPPDGNPHLLKINGVQVMNGIIELHVMFCAGW